MGLALDGCEEVVAPAVVVATEGPQAARLVRPPGRRLAPAHLPHCPWRPTSRGGNRVRTAHAAVTLFLVGVIWMVQVFRQHELLAVGFDPAAHRTLLTANWLRIIAWTGYGATVGADAGTGHRQRRGVRDVKGAAAMPRRRTTLRARFKGGLVLPLLVLVASACGGAETPASSPETASSPEPAVSEEPGAEASEGSGTEASEEVSGTVLLYTSVTQDTVDAVLAALTEAQPGLSVEVFRAPTGELAARLAAEQRAGGIQADVIWHTDPLSMYAHEEEGLLLEWSPEGAEAVPEEFQTATFWGTRILNLVIVHRADLATPPAAWADLSDPAYADGVALPDPGFAGSAFAALGYFGLSPDFGIDYYEGLRGNGAVQLQSINDVITGVAEGRFQAGMALDKTVQDEIDDGAPITMVWPEPGAISVYSPIAVFDGTADQPAAQAFVEFVLAPPGQEAIASTGWQPVLDEVDSPFPPSGAEQVFPDWRAAFGQQDELLGEYRAIFGG